MSESEGFSTLRERLLDRYLSSSAGAVEQWLDSVLPDGAWSDIPYDDPARTAWRPLEHLNRIEQFALAWRKPGGVLYRSDALLDALVKALRFWHFRDPQCVNWWYNHIAVPLRLMRVLILAEGHLPEDVVDRSIARLRDVRLLPPKLATGQNLVWQAGQQIVRGVLRGDGDDIAAASLAIQGELRLAGPGQEGIQVDFSFHQHGPQLYNGTYGLDFVVDSIACAILLHATPWHFTERSITLLADYVLEGQRAMLRGKWFDFSARGREHTRRAVHEAALPLARPARELGGLVAARRDELIALADHIEGKGAPEACTGNRYFWRSEFMTHQRPGWYASVRVASQRVVAAELINAENRLGYWAGFGLTYFVRHGDEYRDIQPVWDWNRLPGTTAPHAQGEMVRELRQPETFAGGVSDGRHGAIAMHLHMHGTRGRKAWFFLDRLVVALGAAICCDGPEPVATTLNQSRLYGPVVLNGEQTHAAYRGEDVQRVWHDGIGYLLAQPGCIALRVGEQSGDWTRINAQYPPDVVRHAVFHLTLEHGVAPRDASYAYAVVPGCNADEMEVLASQPPFRILANDDRMQAICDTSSGRLMAVFHEPGRIDFDGVQVEVSAACLLLLDPCGPDLTLASPFAAAQTIEVQLAGARHLVHFPGGTEGGKSVTITAAGPIQAGRNPDSNALRKR